MAKLPAYDNRQRLDTGSDTFRVMDTGAGQIAQGVSAFGQGVFSAGLSGARQELRAQKEEEARLEKEDAYRDEIEYIRFKDQVQQFEREQRDKGTDDLKDHTRIVDEYSKKLAAESMASGRLSSKNPQKHELMYERLRNPVLDTAANVEASARLEFRKKVSEETIGPIVATTALKGVAGLPEALSEWQSFVERTEGTQSRMGRALMEIGVKRIHRTAFEAEAARRGPEFVAKFQGTLSETPSATTGNPMVDAALKHAPQFGVDPKTAIAIGWIESRLNAGHGKPLRSDGTPMSSAEGGWQIIDEAAKMLGLAPGEKLDPEKATPRVMALFAHNQVRLKQLGHEATPGKTYMFWNVGQGVAENILKADPNTPIEKIIFDSYPSRPGLAAQVLRNNPSMYRAGMTAGQVVQNYESKMANASKATEGYFTGQVTSTPEQMRQLVKDFTGLDSQYLTQKDVAEVFANVSSKLKTQTQEQADVDIGFRHLQNGTADPYSSTDKKAVNRAIESKYGDTLLKGIATGDGNTLGTAVNLTRAAGFIPEKAVHGFRTALDSNDPVATQKALHTLAEISTTNPGAFKASGFNSADVDAVNDYRAYTEVLGLSGGVASERIRFDRSPEGQKLREANAASFKADWKGGLSNAAQVRDRAWSEIAAKFDTSYTSTPTAQDDARKGVLVDAYERGVTYHRLRGRSLEDAKAMTLNEMKASWGQSSVANSSASQHFMAFPPEKVLGADKMLDGSFKWVKDQADIKLRNYLVGAGVLAKSQGGDGIMSFDRDVPLPKYMLVPSASAGADYRAGRPVSYDMWYEDKNGMKQLVLSDPFVPNYKDAKAASEEAFSRRRADADARSRDAQAKMSDPARQSEINRGREAARVGRQGTFGQLQPE